MSTIGTEPGDAIPIADARGSDCFARLRPEPESTHFLDEPLRSRVTDHVEVQALAPIAGCFFHW
jgi:hypothetical protein